MDDDLSGLLSRLQELIEEASDPDRRSRGTGAASSDDAPQGDQSDEDTVQA